MSTRIAYTFSMKVQAYFLKEMPNRLIKYEVGQKIGNCVFVARTNIITPIRQYISVFRCVCGNEFLADIAAVKNGSIKYCSVKCEIRKQEVFVNITKHGMWKSPEYKVWMAMKNRCNSQTAQSWEDYGGRGIKVCERWLNSFDNFFQDMGFRPTNKHSLDRFPDNDGNYESSNCRWATKKDQDRNRRSNINLTYMGKTKCVAEWVSIYNTSHGLVTDRLKRGWSIENALTIPPKKMTKKC